MKRILALVLLILVGVATPVGAEPRSQEAQGVITSPRSGAVVRGKVVITGTATHPDFWKYEVHYMPEPSPTGQWILIGSVHEYTPVVDGRLEIWETDTGLVPDGVYSLRLRVVRRDGNYDEYYVRNITVANQTPTETPTPQVQDTPTPTVTPTPLPPTPTVIIEQPVVPTPTPHPSPSITPTPQPTPTILTELSARRLGGAICYGGATALGLFLVVGVLFVLKWLLSLIFSGLAALVRQAAKRRRTQEYDEEMRV